MAAAHKLSKSDYEKKLPGLTATLTEALEAELKDCIIVEDATTDLWDLPTVDSKTVCKLSPIFEEQTGHKLKPSWVRKGGYETVPEAVTDILDKFSKECVASSAPALAAE